MSFKKIILPRLCLGVLILLHSLFALINAQEVVKDTVIDKVYDLSAIEVYGRKPVSKITTTTLQQVVNSDRISALGLQSIGDVVKGFSGIVVRDYGGVGGFKTVSVRNIGAAHTAISYDGVVVSNAQSGQVDLGKFSLANVGEVSLSIGQNSDPLQSARLYSAAGVLQLHTLTPSFSGEKKDILNVRLQAGSFGHLNPYARYARKISDKTILMADADYTYSLGNYPFTLVNGKEITRERRINSEVSTFHSEINLSHLYDKAGDLNVKGYFYSSRRGLPGSVVLYTQNEKETGWDMRAFAQLRLRRAIKEKWNYQILLKLNHDQNKYQAEGQKYLGDKKVHTFTQNEYYLSGTLLFKPTTPWQIAIAQDAFLNTLKSSLHDQSAPIRTTLLTAMHARYTLAQVKAEATLLHTYKHERVAKGKTPPDLSHWSPMVSISVQPFKNHSLYLRGMIKHTFRVPTFNDMYYDEMGTRNLYPEKAREYSLGLTYGAQSLGALQSLTITLDGYINNVEDKIVAFPATFIWKMRNYGRAKITGADLGISAYWAITKEIKADISGSLTCQSSLNLTDPKGKSYGHQLPYSPRIYGNFSTVLYTPLATVGYTLMGVGRRYGESQNIEANELAGYLEHSLSISRTFITKCGKVRLQANVHNLIDKQYEVVKFYPMPGRSWSVIVGMIF